jgi:hypothetical protein
VNQSFAIGAAVIVISAADVVAGQVIKDKPPAPPQPRTLKLHFEGGDRQRHLMLVSGVTGARPDHVAHLVSDDGRQSARVSALDAAGCAGVTDQRDAGYSGPGETRWCLRFADAPDHGSVVGTAEGVAVPGDPVGPTDLGLTLTTRDAFRWGPALVVIVGLLASLVIAGLGVLWVPLVMRARLRRWIAKGSDIVGLAERARQLRDGDMSAEAVLKIIKRVVRKGPARARTARASLRQALDADPLSGDAAYGPGAQAEATRTDDRVDDFLDASGAAVAHPAARWQAGLEPMRRYASLNETAMKEIDLLLKPMCQGPPRIAFEAAHLSWQQVKTPEQVGGLAEPFAQARTALNLRLAPTSGCLKESEPVAEAAGFARAKDVSIEFSLPTPETLAIGALGVITFLALVVACVLAGAGVWLVTYQPVKTFGGATDYVTLAVAALATGVVASFGAILGPWVDA